MQKVVNLLSLPVVRWAPALHIFTWDALRPPVHAGLDALRPFCLSCASLSLYWNGKMQLSSLTRYIRESAVSCSVSWGCSFKIQCEEKRMNRLVNSEFTQLVYLFKGGNKKNTIKTILPNREPTITAALLCRPSASESLTRSAGGEKVVVGFFSALRDSIQILRVSFLWVKLVCCGLPQVSVSLHLTRCWGSPAAQRPCGTVCSEWILTMNFRGRGGSVHLESAFLCVNWYSLHN